MEGGGGQKAWGYVADLFAFNNKMTIKKKQSLKKKIFFCLKT